MKFMLSVVFFFALGNYMLAQERWQTSSAEAAFTSDAPLELIEAKSNELKGILDFDQKLFAFTIPMKSFQGFNSPLQREHFNENYLDSKRFPSATFSGKIIGEIDLSQNGEQHFRAKGKLTIHGVKQERIIKVNGKVAEGQFIVNAAFSILLEEYGIAIPRIVNQKIVEEIVIKVNAVFEPMLP